MTSRDYQVDTLHCILDFFIALIIVEDSGFTNGITPHIIHMTIKPQEIVDEEDAKMKSGGRDRDGNERSPGCRCIVQ